MLPPFHKSTREGRPPGLDPENRSWSPRDGGARGDAATDWWRRSASGSSTKQQRLQGHMAIACSRNGRHVRVSFASRFTSVPWPGTCEDEIGTLGSEEDMNFGWNRKPNEKPKSNTSIFLFPVHRSVTASCKTEIFENRKTERNSRFKPNAYPTRKNRASRS
jgi:hypothetical protein